MNIIPQRRRERGFTGSPATNVFVKRLAKPNLFSACAWALFWLSFSYIAASIVVFTYTYSPWLGALAVMISIVPVAISQRALELFNHDGGHYNIAGRKHAFLNDAATAVLAAWPVLQTVVGYRRSHAPHHDDFGGAGDQCLTRMNGRDIPDQIRGRTLRVLAWSLRRWPTEVSSYYRAVLTSPKTFLFGAGWHLAAWIAPAALIVGLPRALLLWLLTWLLPFTTALPVIRATAEAEEHDYDRIEYDTTDNDPACGGTTSGSEFATTNSNLGWLHRFVIHPWHDGYHGIHHIYQHVPQYRHPRLHHYLLEHEPRYAESARFRYSLLANAKSKKDADDVAH